MQVPRTSYGPSCFGRPLPCQEVAAFTTSQVDSNLLLACSMKSCVALPLLQGAKVESLLGCTTEQMSYKKALEVLGITQAMMDDERAKILGSLGVKAWSNPEVSTVVADREWRNSGSCGSLFRKRRHVVDEEPSAAPMHGLAPSSHSEVSQISNVAPCDIYPQKPVGRWSSSNTTVVQQ